MASKKEDEGPEFFRDAVVYREWGYRFGILEKYVLAIGCFDKSVEAQDDELRTLLGLCSVLLKYTSYKRASETWEKCRKIDKRHYRVTHMAVETLFNIGKFGHSLLYAHRGLRRRRTPFEEGVYQASEAIEDCIGKNTDPKALLLLYPWIRKLEEYRQALIEKLKEEEDEFEGIDQEDSRFKVNDPVARHRAYSKKLRTMIAKLYLGLLARDMYLLRELTEDPEKLESANKKTSARLAALAASSFARSTDKENLLRMRRPLYTMLFAKRGIPSGHKRMMKDERRLRANNIIVEADFLLQSLHQLGTRKEYGAFFRLVDRVKEKFDSYTDKMFPLKQRCLDAVYKMVGWVYIDARDLRRLDSEETKTIYVKHHLGLRVAELPRDRDIAWIRSSDPKEALRDFRRKLAMALEGLELAWLYHEFSKYLINIGRLDLARFYAKKARETAREAESEQWALNGNHLTLRVEIKQNNRNEAREAALEALADAKKLGIDFLVDFYERAMAILEEPDIDKTLDSDSIAARERLILDLMPDDVKPVVDCLWRSMEAVPARRRLSVMPGCKPFDRETELPCKRRTILPAPPRDFVREDTTKFLRCLESDARRRPGFVDFDEYD